MGFKRAQALESRGDSYQSALPLLDFLRGSALGLLDEEYIHQEYKDSGNTWFFTLQELTSSSEENSKTVIATPCDEGYDRQRRYLGSKEKDG